MTAIAFQSQLNFILTLVISGFSLGGVVGILIGCIAWTASEKEGKGLMNMMIGAITGLIIGFVVVGTGVLNQFTSLESVLQNANQTTSATFSVILRILFFTLVGTSIGGAVSSMGRAISGAIIGVFAGTVAGIILILLNAQLGANILGPTATIIVGVFTLVLVGIMSIGQTN